VLPQSRSAKKISHLVEMKTGHNVVGYIMLFIVVIETSDSSFSLRFQFSVFSHTYNSKEDFLGLLV
jgi:hypothetical protein